MGAFRQVSFNQFAVDNGVIEFRADPLQLNFLRLSHVYINWRTVMADVYLKSKLVKYVLEFIRDQGISARTFYGVPEGATKIGLFVQDRWAQSQKDYGKGAYTLAMGRGRQKEHGAEKDRSFLGTPEGPTVLVEDVSTTGFSGLRELYNLRRKGVEVVGMISLTDRMELTPIINIDNKEKVEEFSSYYETLSGRKYEVPVGVPQLMADLGVRYYSLTNTFQLLPFAIKKFAPNMEIRKAVEEEFYRISVKSRHFMGLKRGTESNPIAFHKSMATRYSDELNNKKVKS